MRFDELFEKRKLTGTKLKDYIRSNGFSKVSFCKKTEISRPTLDKILNGEIDSKSTFDKHLNKILTSLSILTENSEFTPALDSPISVAFKSNDFILCQMYREGALTLDAVRQLRRDDRKLTYTRQQADKSIICRKEVITKEQFIDLMLPVPLLPSVWVQTKA